MSAPALQSATASDGPVRLAIAGFGLVGSRHADVIVRTSEAELITVVDPSEKAAQTARLRNVAHYSSLQEILTRAQPEGVILSTPTRLHAAQARVCIDTGMAVLVEKPLSDDLDAAQALVRIACAADVPLLVGHHRRHNPIIRKAKTMIDAVKIATVRAMQTTCWFYKPETYFDAAPWRHEAAPDWWTPISATRGPVALLINQIERFAEVITGRLAPLVSGTEGLKTLRVVDAIQRAAASGETVTLEALS